TLAYWRSAVGRVGDLADAGVLGREPVGIDAADPCLLHGQQLVGADVVEDRWRRTGRVADCEAERDVGVQILVPAWVVTSGEVPLQGPVHDQPAQRLAGSEYRRRAVGR